MRNGIKELKEMSGITTLPSNLFELQFGRSMKDVADVAGSVADVAKKLASVEEKRGPGAQNMLGCKELTRSRRQAMGDGVRKADGGPKTYDL